MNGPGEAAQTEIGLTGGGNDSNLLYLSGIPHKKVINDEIINQVVSLVEEKVKEKIIFKLLAFSPFIACHFHIRDTTFTSIITHQKRLNHNASKEI